MKTEDKYLFKLVKKAASGDQIAFQEIYNLKWREVHFIALGMMSDFTSAQDVAQETFIKVYNNIGTLKKPETFNTWLYSIVRNTIADLHRYKKNTMHYGMDDIDDYSQVLKEDSEEFLPQDFLERSESKKMLFEVVQSLDDDYRIVVLLFYYKQMSHKEIAEATGSTVSAVKVRLLRARKYMKAKIEKLMQKGVVLYSMPAVPILTIALRSMSEQLIGETVKAASWTQISTTLAASASGAVTVGTAAGTAAAAAAKMTVAQKAAVAVFMTMTCTGAVIASTIQNEHPAAPVESVPAVSQVASSTISDFFEIYPESASAEGIAILDNSDESALVSQESQTPFSSAPPSSDAQSSAATSAPATTTSSPPVSQQSPSSQTATSEIRYAENTLEGILGYENAQDFLLYHQNRTYANRGYFDAMASRWGLYRVETYFEDYFDEKLKRDRYVLYSKGEGGYTLYICEHIKESNQSYDIAYRIQSKNNPAPSWESWEFKNK